MRPSTMRGSRRKIIEGVLSHYVTSPFSKAVRSPPYCFAVPLDLHLVSNRLASAGILKKKRTGSRQTRLAREF